MDRAPRKHSPEVLPAEPAAPVRHPDRFFLARFYRAAKWNTFLVVAILAAALLAGRYLSDAGDRWAWLDPDRTFTVEAPVDWAGVDAEIRKVFREAREKARTRARERLDTWHAELMDRVDREFLPWYFGFWRQQWRDLKAVGYLAADWAGAGDARTAMMDDFRDAFALRVMPPGETQMRMESIARDVLEVYLGHARGHLGRIPREYGVPRDDWQQHLAHIGLQLTRARTQDEQVPTTLKGLVTFGAAGTTALVLRGGAVLRRVGGTALRWAPRAGAAGEAALVGGALRGRLARTGGRQALRTSGRLGGRVLGAAALVGFLAWDIADHYRTRAELQPRLRARLDAYLATMKERMLAADRAGVMAPVRQVESAVRTHLDGPS